MEAARRFYRQHVVRQAHTRRLSTIFAKIESSRLGRWSLSALRRRRAAALLLSPVVRWLLTGIGFTHVAAGQPARLLRTARVLDLVYRSHTRRGHGPATLLYALALFEARQADRLCRHLGEPNQVHGALLHRIVGEALLRDGKPGLARAHFERWVALRPDAARGHRLIGASLVAEQRYAEAAPFFARSVELMPVSVMAYQNFAGRYDPLSYRPASWELAEAASLIVYDTLGQLAEAREHDGQFDDSIRLYRKRLLYQRELARDRELPPELVCRLAQSHPRFDARLPSRILPDEWVTQLGHIAMLAPHRKLIDLGLLPPANYLVLAPAHKIANAWYLAYFEGLFCVLRDPELLSALFPYQRFFGDTFMAAATTDGRIEPWALAAARAEVAWADRPPLLRLFEQDDAFGRAMLRELGVPDNAWYVGLHVREAGFYGENEGDAGSHRNADIHSYLPAIEEIIRRGGWVVRLGDPSMRSLPALPGLVDYARSPQKSPRMDVFLMATSRLIIGTTSGLTTAAQVFGTPLLLANCISNDWQYWHKATHFVVKRIYERAGRRVLSLAETYRSPVQGMLASAFALRLHGYGVHDNTSDEILEATRYKLDRLDGKATPETDVRLVAAYRLALHGNELIFGAATPVTPFLARHPELLVATRRKAGLAERLPA